MSIDTPATQVDEAVVERFAALGLYPSRWTEPFWTGLVEGELRMPRCVSCGHFRFPPSAFCPRCRAQDVDWVTSAGRGTVYTHTVARHPLTPQLRDKVPYVIALVELDDIPGPRLIANLLVDDLDTIRIGMPVVAVHHHAAEARIEFIPAGEER